MASHLSIKACEPLRWVCVAALAATLGLEAKASDPLLLDGFDNPAPAVSNTPTGVGSSFSDRSFGTFAGVADQVRESGFTITADPASQGVTVTLGGGVATVQAGDQVLGEYLFDYGAFTRPNGPGAGGPNMGLDLRAYNDLQATFTHVDMGLNLVAVLYTGAPHLRPDGTPLYYLTTGLNVAPASPDAPLTADLYLDARNNFSGPLAPYFNFSEVDGIYFVIDRSGHSAGNAYTLDTLQFTAAPVPDLPTGALLAAGMGCLALLRWRRPS